MHILALVPAKFSSFLHFLAGFCLILSHFGTFLSHFVSWWLIGPHLGSFCLIVAHSGQMETDYEQTQCNSKRQCHRQSIHCNDKSYGQTR